MHLDFSLGDLRRRGWRHAVLGSVNLFGTASLFLRKEGKLERVGGRCQSERRMSQKCSDQKHLLLTGLKPV